METFSAGIAVRALPFTEVRVDRGFVRDIDRVPVQAAIVVACEGVETGAERDCPVAQDLLRLLETMPHCRSRSAGERRWGTGSPRGCAPQADRPYRPARRRA